MTTWADNNPVLVIAALVALCAWILAGVLLLCAFVWEAYDANHRDEMSPCAEQIDALEELYSKPSTPRTV